MKSITLTFIGILTVGCANSQHFVGKYISKETPNVFQFKSDSTFLNEYLEGHAIKYSTGTWQKMSKNTITIKSEIRNTNIPIKFNCSGSSNSAFHIVSVHLLIDSGLTLPNYGFEVYLNGRFFGEKNADNLSPLKISEPIRSLSLMILKHPVGSPENVFPLHTDTLKFDPPLQQNVDVNVEFKDSYFYYNPFNSVKAKIRRKNIEIYDPVMKKWDTFIKIPDSDHIFVHFKEE